jgi:hypothetical protein
MSNHAPDFNHQMQSSNFGSINLAADDRLKELLSPDNFTVPDVLSLIR